MNPIALAGLIYSTCQVVWNEPKNWQDLAAAGVFLCWLGIDWTQKTWKKKGART